MKLTLIFLLICNVCIGQGSGYNSIYLQDKGTREYISFYIDSSRWVHQLSIQDDSTNVFYYNSGDSSLFVKDSLRSIKWLVKIIIDKMKIETNEWQHRYDSVPNNVAPIALAGLDRVILPTTKTIKLNGTAFDPDGKIVNYHWTQIYGDKVKIKDPNYAETTITNITGWGIYIFQLEVTDDKGDTGKDNIMVKVKYF